MEIKGEIDTIIQLAGKKFIEAFHLDHIAEINDGHCETFRDTVLKILAKRFPNEHFKPVCVRDFEDEEEFENPLFDNLISLPYHAWFMHEDLHYDVTSPKGVTSFYELSVYAYYKEMTQEEREEAFTLLNHEETEAFGMLHSE